MDNMTLDNDLGLNLYIISTTYYIVVISENQRLVKKESQEFLVNFLVNFQTRNYRVSTGIIYQVCSQNCGQDSSSVEDN